MDKHPIENIMTTTMESIRDMVDVNTVIGEPISAGDGSTVIPLSKVSFGFIAGGGEYNLHGEKRQHSTEIAQGDLPFGGGTGAGVTVTPMGFLVVNSDSVRLLPAQYNDAGERMLELVPQLMGELKGYLRECREQKASAAYPSK